MRRFNAYYVGVNVHGFTISIAIDRLLLRSG